VNELPRIASVLMMRVTAASVGLALTACGGSAPTTRPVAASHIEPSRLFPLEAGTVWSFNVRTGDELPTFATLRVLSVSGDVASVQRNRQAPDAVVFDASGIRHQGGAWILRAPIELGASWPAGEDRTARVTAVDETVRTGLGELHDCVRVVEVDGDTGIEAATVYCPDVGPALIVSGMTSELTGDHIEARAELIGRTQVETP
jgi:hypothetical protein